MNLRISAKCRLKKLRVDNALHFIREMSPTLTKAVGHSVSGPGVRAFLTDLTRGAVSCSNIIIRQCSGTGDFAVYLEQQPTIACKCPLNACLESFRWYIVGGAAAAVVSQVKKVRCVCGDLTHSVVVFAHAFDMLTDSIFPPRDTQQSTPSETMILKVETIFRLYLFSDHSNTRPSLVVHTHTSSSTSSFMMIHSSERQREEFQYTVGLLELFLL